MLKNHPAAISIHHLLVVICVHLLHIACQTPVEQVTKVVSDAFEQALVTCFCQRNFAEAGKMVVI